MHEVVLFVGATGEFHEVEAVVFEDLAQLASFFGLEPAVLKFNAVELDAEDEGGGDAGLDGVCDLNDDAGAVGEGAAVFVGTEVGAFGEELCEEITWVSLAWCA